MNTNIVNTLKPWWQLNLDSDETRLFQVLARNPDYIWRSQEGLLKSLGWSDKKFMNTAQRFLSAGMILTRTNDKKGTMQYAYWENVKSKDKKQSAETSPFIPRVTVP